MKFLRAWLAERRIKREWDREFIREYELQLYLDAIDRHVADHVLRVVADAYCWSGHPEAQIRRALHQDDHDAHVVAATEFRDAESSLDILLKLANSRQLPPQYGPTAIGYYDVASQGVPHRLSKAERESHRAEETKWREQREQHRAELLAEKQALEDASKERLESRVKHGGMCAKCERDRCLGCDSPSDCPLMAANQPRGWDD